MFLDINGVMYRYHRIAGTKIEEILAKITTPDGWDVERTTMYMDENRCIMGCPFLKAIYQDAKQLLESCA